jgi:hypothetical protein
VREPRKWHAPLAAAKKNRRAPEANGLQETPGIGVHLE